MIQGLSGYEDDKIMPITIEPRYILMNFDCFAKSYESNSTTWLLSSEKLTKVQTSSQDDLAVMTII